MELFDEETLSDLKFRAKKQLRTRMRGLRAAYPAAVLAQASARIVLSVLGLPEFAAARSVGSFWPMTERHEVDVRPLADAVLSAGKRAVFSVFAADRERRLQHRIRCGVCRDELAERGQRFFEPPLAAHAPSGVRSIC